MLRRRQPPLEKASPERLIPRHHPHRRIDLLGSPADAIVTTEPRKSLTRRPRHPEPRNEAGARSIRPLHQRRSDAHLAHGIGPGAARDRLDQLLGGREPLPGGESAAPAVA
ncbi:hypothetical protein ACFVSU_14970 [Microbacterium sp. NPDC058062]|uniref:hypothetical protein n=1 Tax=Microbacterium sp. NPDC058062 TaxID=3346320 RepID=UPI0036DF60AA